MLELLWWWWFFCCVCYFLYVAVFFFPSLDAERSVSGKPPLLHPLFSSPVPWSFALEQTPCKAVCHKAEEATTSSCFLPQCWGARTDWSQGQGSSQIHWVLVAAQAVEPGCAAWWSLLKLGTMHITSLILVWQPLTAQCADTPGYTLPC